VGGEMNSPAHAHDLNILALVAGELGPDEVRTLVALARRLLLGQQSYGALDVRTDPRKWQGEARDEALDLAVYLAVDLIKREGAT